jgi:hypothetical protein
VNLPAGAVLAYSFEPEARYWPAITARNPGMVPDICVQAAYSGDGCEWEFVIEDHGAGEVCVSRSSGRRDLDQARAQAPELFAALAEMRPRTLEEVRAVLVLVGAEDITIR